MSDFPKRRREVRYGCIELPLSFGGDCRSQRLPAARLLLNEFAAALRVRPLSFIRRRKRLAGVVRGAHHFFDFFLLHVERKIMR